MISGLEKRLSGVQQDFTQAIHKISEKDTEKFDLIFAILSELQQRQALLEESVRSLKSQYGNGQMVPNGNANCQSQMQQPQQFGQMNGQMAPMNSQMGMAGQQPMQQFAGVMQQPDGSQAMCMAMPQQMILMSPPNNGGMQYAAVPQMMTQNGAVVQQMPQMMQVPFVPQNGTMVMQGQDMNTNFMNGQEACGPSPSPDLQAQMDMIGKPNAEGQCWQNEDSAAIGQQQLNDSTEVPSQSGIESSETSSQEGKIDNPGA